MIAEQWDQLPDELRYLSQWCIAAPDKSPYTTSGHRASVTDPSHWTDWYSASTVAATWGEGAGIGFVLSEDDDLACIDLDIKDNTPPEHIERFNRIVEAFDSYTERSRSGRGLHIWVRGKVGMGCRRDGVEIYSQQRFMICTGDVVLHKPVEHRQELLDILVSEIRAAAQTSTVELVEQAETETDEDIWQKAADAANGDKFKQLWTGDWAGAGYPSQSEADLSLLSMLCFYSKSNEQVRRLFRLSGLGQRDKAQKNNRYLDRTLGMIRGRQKREEELAGNALQLAQTLASTLPLTPPQKTACPPAKCGPNALLPLTWPPGFLGELAKWFYSVAPRPVQEVAIVSALGVAAGMFGRLYNISGSGLNLYIVLVARSAIGKEAMHSGISKLCHIGMETGFQELHSFLDFADYASGPALIKAISQGEHGGSFCNVAGEWGRKLRKMSDDHSEGPMSSLRTVMTNLYQKSSAGTIVGGIGYSDKEKNVAATNGVAYSMIGETTPDTFYESLTNTMMQDGFMSRFIVIEYAGERPQFNAATNNPFPEPMGHHMRHIMARLKGAVEHVTDVVMSREAHALMDEFDARCDGEINGTDDESWRQMWNRAHLKALKVSALLACCDNYSTPVVTEQHARWALNLIMSDIDIMQRKIKDGDVGDGDPVRERKVLSVLAEYLQNPLSKGYNIPDSMRRAGVVPRRYLQARLQRTNCFTKHKLGHSAALDLTIRSLVDSGYLAEYPKDKVHEQWGAAGKCFAIVSDPTA